MSRTLLLALLLYASPAIAIQLDQNGCAQMAVWSGDIVWARNVGASKEKVKRFLQENKDEPVFFQIILRYFDEIWASKDDRLTVIKAVYQDCANRRGNYGTGV